MNGRALTYLQRHWRGECSLAWAFWINFLLLFFALNYLERFTLPPYLHGELLVTVSAIVFFIVVRLLIYSWQVVGVIRACERQIKSHSDRSWAVAAEGVVVLSIAATLAMTFSGYQSWLGYKYSLRVPAEIERAYQIDLINENTLLHVRGTLEIGITARVADMLAEHPQVSGIILDSGGGQIYEGRGLARLIRENQIATYSLEQCVSSCTIAFIAGTTRTLGDNARLGFHQYKNYAVLPAVDIAEEHARDIALFKTQGISDVFLNNVFAQPPDGMWWPETDELLRAGVVHETGFVVPVR